MPRVRLPLVGSINTRVGDNDLLPGVSAIVGEAIAGMVVVGTSPTGSAKDQRFINCFPIVYSNKITGKQTPYLTKRPGFVEFEQPQNGSPGSAIFVWSGQGIGTKVISAFGATNSSIYDGETRLVTDNTDTTTISGVATGITETQLSSTPTLCITSTDNTAWHYQNAGTVTKITSSNFPGNAGKTLAGTFAHLGGFPFIMTTEGRIYNGEVNQVATWLASSWLQASSYPDIGVGCVRWRNYIVGFCRQTMGFFRNAGNPSGSPLTRVDQMDQKIGLCNYKAIVEFTDMLFWVGSNPQGGMGVYMLDGSVKRISTPAVELKLILAGPSNISCAIFSFFGTTHLFIKASTLTLAYCVESDFWYEISGSEPLWERSAASSVGSTTVCYAVSGSVTNGKTYILNPSSNTFADDGRAYQATVVSAPIDIDTNKRKKWRSMAVIGDKESAASALSVSWSDDDYRDFSVARSLDLSTRDTRLYRLGTSRERVFRFDHSANTPMRIRALEIDYEVTAE